MTSHRIDPSDPPLRILLVEDSATFAKLVTAQIHRDFHLPHTVCHVDRIDHAIAQLRADVFDLIVLDMNLPDSCGMKTFRTVHRLASESPIVILSGEESDALSLAAVRHGAQDFLVKGHHGPQRLMRSLRFAIERKKRLRAEGELNAAHLVQESLLPAGAPNVPGLDIAGAMFPAEETAGDYFDFFTPLTVAGKQAIGLVVADVSGHGLGPALVMAELRGCLRSLTSVESDLGKILTLTDRVVSCHRSERFAAMHFVTMFLAWIDPARRRLHYAAAGHPAWHFHADGTEAKIESKGVPLGVSNQFASRWQTETPIALGPGDILLVATDGVQEAFSAAGNQFGHQRMLDSVRANRQQSAEQIIQRLHGEVCEHTKGGTRSDDITIVVVKVSDMP
jgi:serine phosphatase RsbU (regulator of sigma subunit)